MDGGLLAVTRISVSGFWVTDTSRVFCPAEGGGMRRCASSLFSFNFRLPEGMRPCDRLSRLSGTVQEFVGTTQMSQPAWTIPAEGLFTDQSGMCPIPEAVVLRPKAMGEMVSSAPALEVLDMASMDEALEPLENALVRLQNVTIPQNVGPARASCDMAMGTCTYAPGRSNCDFTGDNVVDFDNPLEALCANTCQKTTGCSEWTGWIRFGQMAVDFGENQPGNVQRFIIAPREAIPNFEPIELTRAGRARDGDRDAQASGPELDHRASVHGGPCVRRSRNSATSKRDVRISALDRRGVRLMQRRVINSDAAGTTLSTSCAETMGNESNGRPVIRMVRNSAFFSAPIALALAASLPASAWAQATTNATGQGTPANAPAQQPASSANSEERSHRSPDTRLTWTFGDDDVLQATGSASRFRDSRRSAIARSISSSSTR